MLAIIEVAALVLTVILGTFWLLNPQGNFEPVIVILGAQAGLAYKAFQSRRKVRQGLKERKEKQAESHCVTGNLPRSTAHFVGRETELAEMGRCSTARLAASPWYTARAVWARPSWCSPSAGSRMSVAAALG